MQSNLAGSRDNRALWRVVHQAYCKSQVALQCPSAAAPSKRAPCTANALFTETDHMNSAGMYSIATVAIFGRKCGQHRARAARGQRVALSRGSRTSRSWLSRRPTAVRPQGAHATAHRSTLCRASDFNPPPSSLASHRSPGTLASFPLAFLVAVMSTGVPIATGTGERRKGKWTYEEEAYATRLIRDFKAGILPLRDGASLRAYLAEKLNCEPMRITKKFARTDCIGKVTFRPASLTVFPPELRAIAAREAEELRGRFLLREAQVSVLPRSSHPIPAPRCDPVFASQCLFPSSCACALTRRCPFLFLCCYCRVRIGLTPAWQAPQA